jgi:hypothetical protein
MSLAVSGVIATGTSLATIWTARIVRQYCFLIACADFAGDTALTLQGGANRVSGRIRNQKYRHKPGMRARSYERYYKETNLVIFSRLAKDESTPCDKRQRQQHKSAIRPVGLARASRPRSSRPWRICDTEEASAIARRQVRIGDSIAPPWRTSSASEYLQAAATAQV